jgi:hypothetical protein
MLACRQRANGCLLYFTQLQLGTYSPPHVHGSAEAPKRHEHDLKQPIVSVPRAAQHSVQPAFCGIKQRMPAMHLPPAINGPSSHHLQPLLPLSHDC